MFHKNMTGKKKVKEGFSLLELLVVISIILILITLGTSSFATAQKKARDAKRRGDLKEIQTSMEQYYSVCGYAYPLPQATTYYQSINCSSPAISIMPTVPMDPRSTPYYCETPATDCTADGFRICTNLEAETVSQYCVLNQQ